LRDLPRDPRPAIALAGRSNVGKSSLINCLVGRTKLAKVSAAPGKTQQIHFYLINEQFYFVDLPGYGYARVSKGTRQSWQNLVEGFLIRYPNLRGVVHITDARRALTESDAQLQQWLSVHRIPSVVVATKADKLSQNDLQRQLAQVKSLLPSLDADIVPFSAKTGLGKRALWGRIQELL